MRDLEGLLNSLEHEFRIRSRTDEKIMSLNLASRRNRECWSEYITGERRERFW